MSNLQQILGGIIETFWWQLINEFLVISVSTIKFITFWKSYAHYWNDFLPQSNFGKKGLFSKNPLLKWFALFSSRE